MNASVGIILPTATPATFTLAGSTCARGGATVVVGVVVVGTGVVVVVGTVVVVAGTVVVVAGTVVVVTDTVVVVVDGGGSSRTAADAPPARANPTRKRRARPLRLTAKV
jgi:hypothetical protein